MDETTQESSSRRSGSSVHYRSGLPFLTAFLDATEAYHADDFKAQGSRIQNANKEC